MQQTKPELKIIKLGSEVGATKNMTVYECGDDIIVVDCGIGFPDADLPGVDVVIPDITYLLERKDRVRGIFVTHGHEDHFGAIAYIIDELNVPIYASKLVQGLISLRIKDRSAKTQLSDVSFHLFNASTGEEELGNFKISAFNVNHSVPGTLGFLIKTPQGNVVHMADYKIDLSPVLDSPIDLASIAKIADTGVLCLLSDCLGVTHEGYSKTEKALAPTINYLVQEAEGKQIFVTTISSNISRMYQLIEAAVRHGRKVVFVGRSIDQTGTLARQLGYLPFADDVFVELSQAENYLPGALLYIVAGCYGQQGSALDRLARGEHDQLHIEEGDMVIFSADPGPPSSYEPVEVILHNLTVAGAEVIYSAVQDNLHVSGHGTRGDLETIASIVKPKYFIPIGGTAAKMRAYTNMTKDLGYEGSSVFELLEGESVVFSSGIASKGERVEVQDIYIDGNVLGNVSSVVIRDRELLCDDGIFVVVVPVSKDMNTVVAPVDVITRGFVYVKESKSIIGRARDLANKLLEKEPSLDDWGAVRNRVERKVIKFLQKETGRKPLIIVSAIKV